MKFLKDYDAVYEAAQCLLYLAIFSAVAIVWTVFLFV
jgi:hypothetical protein